MRPKFTVLVTESRASLGLYSVMGSSLCSLWLFQNVKCDDLLFSRMSGDYSRLQDDLDVFFSERTALEIPVSIAGGE